MSSGFIKTKVQNESWVCSLKRGLVIIAYNEVAQLKDVWK